VSRWSPGLVADRWRGRRPAADACRPVRAAVSFCQTRRESAESRPEMDTTRGW